MVPNNIVIFPDRDMVSLEGYEGRAGQVATLTVTRAGVETGRAQGTIGAGDPSLEVNHPGGVAWGTGPGAAAVTPDIRAGDVVSAFFSGGGSDSARVQSPAVTGQTLVGNTLTVDGIRTVPGQPAPNNAQMEQRIVNPDLLATNVLRRDVRAVLGPLTPAANGSYSSSLSFTATTFTATFVFTSSAAAAIAEAGQMRALTWMFETAAADRQGMTIAELGEANGPGIPGGPPGPGGVGPATPPVAPASVTSIGGLNSALVRWTARGSGGAPITSYQVRVVNSAGAQVGALRTAPAVAPGAATSLKVTGLVNESPVRFQVAATNSVNRGAFSALSAVLAPPSRLSDFNGDGNTDLVTRDAAGGLWLYRGTGNGGYAFRTQMGAGWNGLNAIVTPGDVTGDGRSDILARTAAGALRVYPGNGAGKLAPSRQIGTGWAGMFITNAGDMTGDARGDLLARDSAGRLFVYPIVGNAVLQTRRLVGTGWAGMTAIRGAGDLSGDGKADILARNGAGALLVFRGNGVGRVNSGTLAGTGFAGMTALVAPGHGNRAAGNDLLTRDAAGRLFLYSGNNAGRFGTRTQVGGGFQAFTFLG